MSAWVHAASRRGNRAGASVPVRVIRQLAEFFERNGYVRRQIPRRVREEDWKQYRKGDEVRLVANSAAELDLMRRLLNAAGFRPGRPFAKSNQYRLPLYGRQETARFLALLQPATDAGDGAPAADTPKRTRSRVSAGARRVVPGR